MKKLLLLIICFYSLHLGIKAQSLLVLSEEGVDVSNDTIDGTFTGSSALMVSVGLGYKF